MKKRKIKELEASESSGNVFADLGFKNPEEMMAKANLAILISDTIKKRKLKQKQAAEIMGIDQPKVSAILRGRLSGFTIERLMRFLMALGMDIIIEAKPHTQRKNAPYIQVLLQKPVPSRRLNA
jgi:predicted XRE-type DNA-binding protein